MEILRDISFLFSMLHIVVLFLLLFEPRFSWRTTLIISFAGVGTLLAVNVLVMFWLGHGIIMNAAFFSCTLPSLLLFLLLSKYRDGRFFFLFCLTDTVCFWLLQVTNFLDRLAGGAYVVLLISRLILFPIVEFLFWRYLRRPYLALQAKLTKSWWLFAAVGAVYYLLIMITSVPVDTPLPDGVGLARILLVLLLMPLTYLTILRSLWRQMQLYEEQHLVELQRRDYSAIHQKVELERILRHDMHHHLAAIEGMLQQWDSAGAIQYIRSLSGRLAKSAQVPLCPNPTINAVLTAYIAQAEEAGCRVEADIRVPEELPYQEMDLCILLANVLENAVNACRSLTGHTPLIGLKLETTGNRRLVLAVDNPCPLPVSFGADGLPLPSRRGPEHGLGLRSVKRVVERYGGFLRCQWQDGKFLFQAVLFPTGEETSAGFP